MKMFKKLIPAIAMLVLSAAMVVTSSFAWFSTNSTVTATNMQITANADQLFLQIIAGKDAKFDNTQQISAEALNNENENNTEKKYIPTSVVDSFTSGEAPVPFVDGKPGFTWVTATSASPDSSTVSGVNSYKAVEDIQLYALINTFKIRLNPLAGKKNASGSLICKSVTLTGNEGDAIRNSISVLVVNSETEQAMLFKQEGGQFVNKSGDADLSGTKMFNKAGATDEDYATIVVYIFFDGEHADCKTNNVKPNAYNISLTFDCTGAATDAPVAD